MSKMSKLMKNPVLFFKDRKKNILKRESAAKKSVARKAPKKDPEVIKSVKHIFSTIINEIPVANASLAHHEVALYFAGSLGNIYQVEQWIGTFNILNEKKKLVVIVRVKEVYDWLRENTTFVVVYCRTIEDLTKVYEENNFKCVLYVNHGFKNFQSLITGDALHVHINHGESDKTSTITNQSKGYDYIFIVGDAGYDKYNLNLIKKNMDNFIQVGRPQLDHIEEIAPFDAEKLKAITYPEIPELTKPQEDISKLTSTDEQINKIEEPLVPEPIITKRKVILYAPTWEGTHDSMNFTSLNDYGMSLVQQLTNHPDYYLVYKPHPNTGSRDASTKSINNAIIRTSQLSYWRRSHLGRRH